MPSLESVLASLPGIGGYAASQQFNQQQQMGQLAQIAALQNIAQNPLKTQLLEAQVREHQLAPDIKQQGMENTRQMALARLQQAAAQNDQMMQFRMSQAKTAAEQAAIQNAHRQMADRIAAERLKYDTGAVVDVPPMAAAPQQAMPSFEQAMGAIGGRRGPQEPFTMQVDAASPQPVNAPPAQATPPQAVHAAPPVAAPVAPQAMPAMPAMPPEIARAPKKVQDAWALATAKNGAADKPQGDFSKTGEEYLATLPEADRQLVKKLASYEIDSKTLSQRGGHREKMLAQVAAYDPSFDDTQYANKRRAITQFGSGPQGNTVRALNVAIEHIDTLQRAADALKNGDFTPGNKAYNEVAKVFGVTPPNTFEGIRDIVANEVVKGTIGTSGALMDRAEAAAKVKAASSPAQLKELMNAWTELMGGQVKGLEQQYQGATGLKDFRERYLRQRTMDAISLAESKAAGGGATAGGIPEGQKATSKSGKPMTYTGGKWVYD